MNIPERILLIMKEKKLTQKGLSEYIHVATSSLNNWLKLGRDIPAQYIIPISEFLGVSLSYLLTGIEKDPVQMEGAQWEDINAKPVKMTDDEIQLAAYRVDRALTARIEEVVREMQSKEENRHSPD